MQHHTQWTGAAEQDAYAASTQRRSAVHATGALQPEPSGGGAILLPLFVGLSLLVIALVAVLVKTRAVWMLPVASGLEVVVIAGSLVWLMLLLADHPEAPATVTLGTMGAARFAPAEGRHHVLVIANRGLEDPRLCAEVCSRGTRSETDVTVIAQVVAAGWLHSVLGDIDAEQRVAQGRVNAGLQTLLRNGVRATGHTVVGQPITSLLDGLREFPASEVVMLNGGEAGWTDASTFAERVRSQFGLRVTEVDPSPGSPRAAPQPEGAEEVEASVAAAATHALGKDRAST